MRKSLPGIYTLTILFLLSGVASASDKIQVEVVESSGDLTPTSTGILTNIFAKVILPDGSHASLLCGGNDNNCAKIESFAPEKMPPDSTKCTEFGNTTTCTTTNLGKYSAVRKGNVLIIFAPNGKLRFKIVGSW
jgi:hypothetical protein